ncbi:MAG: hypothetical protein JXP34_08365 [Planctomycetes bacterium]|nr:hypothetical protein [Planctomycetota bacterium]
MKRNILVLSIVGLVVGIVGLSVFLVGDPTPAQAAPNAAPQRAAAKKATPEFYCVVRVGTEYQIVKKTELEAFKKKLESEYKEKVKAYEEAKAAARKDKRKFEDPRPVLYRVTVLSTFRSEQQAQAHIEKLKAAEEKRKAAAEARKKAAEEAKKKG